MLNKIYAIVALAIVATPAYAGDYVSGNSQVLYAPESDTFVSTVEASWSEGKFSGFSFLDIFSKGSLEYLTEHSVNYAVTDKFFLSTELSKSNFGETVRLGFGTNLSLPGMVYTTVTAYPGVYGNAGQKAEIDMSWRTKDLTLTDKLAVYSSGFFNIPKDSPGVFQPQGWLKHSDLPVEIGFEYAIFGQDRALFIAAKANF